MKKNSIYIIFLILISGIVNGYAQEKESAAKPLELPNFIIEGKEQLNVRSGIKQFPDKPKPLTNKELDSLNTLEKKLSLMLPTEALPDRILHPNLKNGFIRSDFGRYTTFTIEGGYEYRNDGYDIFGNAGADIGKGHVDNADYSKLNINLNADFVADEKYWLFGGSKTRTYLSIDDKNYKLYAAQSAPERNALLLNAGVVSDGDYDGLIFSAGANVKTLQFLQDSGKAFDNALSGFIKFKVPSNQLSFGGDFDIAFHNIRGNGLMQVHAIALTEFYMQDVTIAAQAGLQMFTNSLEESRFGLYISGNLTYRLNGDFTLNGSVRSCLERNNLIDAVQFNPYISNDAVIDYSYILPEFKANILYHPNETFALSGGIIFSLADRTPVFVNQDTSSFKLEYLKTTKIGASLEGVVNLSGKDILIGNAGLEIATLNGGKKVPYSALIKFSADYRRSWTERFGTQIGIMYLSERFVDLENINKLKGAFDLHCKADYIIVNNLKIYAKFENLLNNDIFVWNGYKEKGLFIAGGLLWQF